MLMSCTSKDIENILKVLEEQDRKISEIIEKMKNINEILTNLMGEEITLLGTMKDVGSWKKKDCHYYKEGFCWWWYWWGEAPKDLPFVLKLTSYEGKWFMDPHPFYCALCSMWKYKER